jgi:colicin import membrane protein
VRRSFTVSSIVHIAFLIVIIFPGFESRRREIVEVINVRLVGEEKKQQPKAEVKQVKPAEPEPQPEKKTEKSEMAYETKTKKRETKKEVEPAQEKPKTAEKPKTETRTEEPPKEQPKTQGVQPTAGATSNVRVDDEDFRFAYYLEIIKERVSFNWSPPPVSGGLNVMCTVYFKIMRDGRISSVKVEQGSGFDLFDRAAVRAVNLSGPMPPLPAGFDGRWLGVHFEFQQTSG